MSSTDQLMMMLYHKTQTPGQAKLSLTGGHPEATPAAV